ncbi:YbaK/EbsC family protein [Oscillospiraceae bacterium HV4-5-C5C]|nr:YbaK/EbsC family protein [Oscillospiraceae bacterium HV4-5-C5C]
MSISNVRSYLKQYGLDQRIREFSVSSATVQLAAEALGCDPDRIAKSLTFMVNEQPTMVVMSGKTRVNNARFRAAFDTKAKMLSPWQVETLVGHAVGGVCPFALKPGVRVYLDQSLRQYATVFPACGSSNSAIELSISELECCSGYISWVDVGQVSEAAEKQPVPPAPATADATLKSAIK